MKTITLNGKKFKLVPIKEKKEPISLISLYKNEETKIDKKIVKKNQPVVQEIAPPTGKVRKAVPKISGYRERFKQKKLTPRDFIHLPSVVAKTPEDNQLNKFVYQGESLFFGPGVEQEL